VILKLFAMATFAPLTVIRTRLVPLWVQGGRQPRSQRLQQPSLAVSHLSHELPPTCAQT
jgi:hypothetical protein